MGILDRLFGRRGDDAGADELLTRALDRAVEVVEPKLALASDWRTRLLPGVKGAVEFARSTAGQLQDVHEATPAAWNGDPVVRAVFATADDVSTTLGRSDDLRSYLQGAAAGNEAFAVLGADFETRRVLGAALEGDHVRQDSALTQAHFGAHRIRIVAASPEALRQSAGVRVFNELLLAATRRLADADQQRKDLDVTRAMLQARLRMLERGETTLEPAGSSGSGDVALERADVERQLAAMTGAMEDLGAGVQGIDRKLEIVRDTLLEATQSIRVERRQLRLDAMNTVLEDETQGGSPIEFVLITTREFTRAYVPIHVRRSDVPQGGLKFADAERVL